MERGRGKRELDKRDTQSRTCTRMRQSTSIMKETLNSVGSSHATEDDVTQLLFRPQGVEGGLGDHLAEELQQRVVPRLL